MNIFRKLLIALPIVTLLLSSCSSDDDGTRIQETYEFQTDSELSIEVDPNFAIEDGDETPKFVNVCGGSFTVFKYTFRNLGMENVADSGFSKSIYFQVDNALNSFEFTDTELKQANAIYQLSCFCVPEATNPFYLEKGTISGEKLESGSWDISIDLEIDEEEIISEQEVFEGKDDLFQCVIIETETETEIEEISFTEIEGEELYEFQNNLEINAIAIEENEDGNIYNFEAFNKGDYTVFQYTKVFPDIE